MQTQEMKEVLGVTTELVTVQSHDIDEIWPSIEKYAESVCARSNGKYSPEDFYEELKTAKMQLWCAIADEGVVCAVGTRIVDYPQKKVCRIEFCGGKNYKSWIAYTSVIEEWAKSLGCNAIEVVGRKGWTRLYKDYKEQEITLSKDLS